MEKIFFDYSVAIILVKELEKKGIYKRISVFDKDSCLFTQEELDMIEELVLENVTNIKNIEYLRNLKKLTLQSAEYSRYSEDIDIKSACFINYINDFKPIEKIKGLEELTIVNDVNIKKLDLTELKDLKNIKLINNPRLEELIGLDKLTNLKNVMIYGTSIHTNIDIISYIKNTQEAETNILDVNMYQSLVKNDEVIPEMISKAVVTGDSQLCFAELVGLMEYALIDAQSLEKMYAKADLIFKLFNVYNLPEESQVNFVYNYVANQTFLNKDVIIDRDKKYTEYIERYSEIPSFAKKKMAMIHSSYNAFIVGKSNCEGIVNMMKFMLNMLGIRSFNVHCIDKRTNINDLPNHSMLRVLQDGTWYYYDPSIKEEEPYLFCKKTYDEIRNMGYHILNAFEASVNKEAEYESYHK